MKVILKENVDGLGIIGDIVNVKPGYARNFLLPKGLVIEASSKNVKQMEHEQRQLERKRQKVMEAAELLKAKIEGLTLEFTAKAGAGGKLFGSITTMDLAEKLAEAGVEIDKKKISIDTVKNVGTHEGAVKLDGGLTAALKVVIAGEAATAEEEAAQAAKEAKAKKAAAEDVAEAPAEEVAEEAAADEASEEAAE